MLKTCVVVSVDEVIQNIDETLREATKRVAVSIFRRYYVEEGIFVCGATVKEINEVTRTVTIEITWD
jgi:hypothetical protein